MVEQQAKEEFEREKAEEQKHIEEFMFKIHGKWINGSDFSKYPISLIKKQSKNNIKTEQMLIKEIDEKEECTEQYNKFIDLYIKLYYEPLVEEYDEMKYFTRNYD